MMKQKNALQIMRMEASLLCKMLSRSGMQSSEVRASQLKASRELFMNTRSGCSHYRMRQQVLYWLFQSLMLENLAFPIYSLILTETRMSSNKIKYKSVSPPLAFSGNLIKRINLEVTDNTIGETMGSSLFKIAACSQSCLAKRRLLEFLDNPLCNNLRIRMVMTNYNKPYNANSQ